MTEKLCGPCSIEHGLSKEERIKLGMSRMPNEVYTCPVCKKEHSYKVTTSKKMIQAEVPIKPEPKKAKITKKRANQEQEQLQLF